MVKFLVQVDLYKFLDCVSPSLHNGYCAQLMASCNALSTVVLLLATYPNSIPLINAFPKTFANSDVFCGLLVNRWFYLLNFVYDMVQSSVTLAFIKHKVCYT